jgi:aryl-alcohol dehydrogenase-like predicted oxidoreductase
VKAAIDHGLFYFDCADIYGLGASEEVVGALLKELLPRDEYVLATKIAMPMGHGANQGGLSRKHVREGIDACLQRTGHDYIDHLVIHRHPHGIPSSANAHRRNAGSLGRRGQGGQGALFGRILNVRVAVCGTAVNGQNE